MENKVQTNMIKYLRAKGCYVIKTKPQPGVPTGCPDIIFMSKKFWGAIECKSSEKAPWQPLQEETLTLMNNWSWAKKVHSGNLINTIAELERIL